MSKTTNLQQTNLTFTSAIIDGSCEWTREAVIINKLRAGPCRLTHSYLMSADGPPVCESCRLPLSQVYTSRLPELAGHSLD